MIRLEDSGRWLRSDLLTQIGILHGFTSAAVGDGVRLGVEGELHALGKQVHGRGVTRVTRGNAHERPEADALVTDEPGVVVNIRTADCTPILLASRDGRCVAAVHAGWRGVVAEVVTAALDVMCESYGVSPAAVVAAIGPCIGVEKFEVGEEVAEAFEKAQLGVSIRREAGRKPHIDLTRAVTMQLERAGVPSGSIDTSTHCTYRDAELFHSYRRQGSAAGRMSAMITPGR